MASNQNSQAIESIDMLAPRYAALDERVTNLRTTVTHLESVMNQGFSAINQQLANLSTELRGGQRTQWPVIWSAIGVCFTILVAIGSLAYLPINRATGELREALRESTVARAEADKNISDKIDELVTILPDKFVPRAEFQALSVRGAESRKDTLDAIVSLRNDYLPRNEWELRNGTVDHELQDLGRRIDEVRTDLGSTYSLKDALQDFKQRLDRIEYRGIQ